MTHDEALPPFATMTPVDASPPRALVFASCLERRAAWSHAMGMRGFMPVPVTTTLEAIFELVQERTDIAVVDGSRELFRPDVLGLVRLILEEDMSRMVIVDRRLRDELTPTLRHDPRLRTLSAHPPVMGEELERAPALRHIVLAEDDVHLRRALSRRLRHHGFKVTEVEDGMGLLAAIEDVSTVDLVVSDVRMPRLDGPAALGSLVERAPEVPVVLMTAFPNDDVYRAAEYLGAKAVLEKPVSLRTLVDTIESVSLAA